MCVRSLLLYICAVCVYGNYGCLTQFNAQVGLFHNLLSYLCKQKHTETTEITDIPNNNKPTNMRKLALLLGLLPYLASLGQGYKVYKSDGKVDAYSGETAVSVSLNDDSLRYAGHEYVDLGLPSGTRWATANAGAAKCNPNGLHYSFGRAKTDGLWGGDWRMPGIPEYQELLRVCQWEWTKQGICQGYCVTGPNGNTLFLPAAGFIEPNGSLAGGLTGQVGGYWTGEGYNLSFSASEKGLSPDGSALQLSLRPVIGGKATPDVRSGVVQDGPHDYVDLGLSVLWATTNIGAETPEDFGDYFGLGCTEPTPSEILSNSSQPNNWLQSHSPFYYNNYVDTYYYMNGREEEYNDWYQQYQRLRKNNYWGEMDSWLLPEHDAAATLWGDGWRMPTLSEYKELMEKTTKMTYTNKCIFQGSNGNTLTLPRAGYYRDGSFSSYSGYYMTSSIFEYPLMVDVSQRTYTYDSNSYGGFFPIRPVKDKPKAGLTDEATTAQQEMVDLGLSVMWANCNWGAATPTDKGEYVAFGETMPKAEYTKSNYQWHPYSPQSTQAMFGKSGWTLPTLEEADELINRCTWVREADGFRVTGPNGNSIFLPYTGYRSGAVLNYPDELGMYWIQLENDGLALQLRSNGNYNFADAAYYSGMAVRPVMKPIHPETGEAQTDWHSATITCKARGNYREFGIQLSFVKEMDNRYSGASIIFSDYESLQDGKYAVKLQLQPNTPYYYRAYAITADSIPQTLYGDIRQLHTTADVPAVDLGLSVKWAAVNLGATSENDSLYFCYYPDKTDMGKLPAIFDGVNSGMAPISTWGEGWQIPTEVEFRELMDRCEWVWTSNGYRVTGPNGNSIFLPYCSVAFGDNGYQGGYGRYWTQTPSERYAGCNSILKFTETDKKISFGPPTNTYNIRPVKK